jgi:hypothetical protein
VRAFPWNEFALSIFTDQDGRPIPVWPDEF